MLDYSKSLIETQFPVAKVSKESYRERKAVQSQTLTGLGKWWGRKPLILVRAALFGALLPVSDDPKKDKEIFLKILTMDNAGIALRKGRRKGKVAVPDDAPLTYENLTKDCCRPEEIDGPSEESWKDINAHLETTATSLQDLVQQLGMKRYGHIPIVGDCFSGGGSNIFEAARLGCNVFGSDLNPIAGLLTWADLNILGCSQEEKERLESFQETVFDAVCKELDSLKLEVNEYGDVAKYYLYCNETKCPECGWTVPMFPSVVVSQPQSLIAELEEDLGKKFRIHLKKVDNIKTIDKTGTIDNGFLVCPHCHKSTSVMALRGGIDGKFLRKWEKSDFVNKESDLFSERLYAIKYVRVTKENKTLEGLRKKPQSVTDATFGFTYYREPNEHDIANETKVLRYLERHFNEWQSKGFIPSVEIYSGLETDRLPREKGWQYWHQLYNPRQLLTTALLVKYTFEFAKTDKEFAVGILGINNVVNRFSKLSIWNIAKEKGEQTFSNQALNTLNNYACRSSYTIYILWKFLFGNFKMGKNRFVTVCDAVTNNFPYNSDIWITDPPYADAVNYHELSEYFLAWDVPIIKKAFPEWYTDSKRALAIKGTGLDFNKSMVAAYRNLAEHMSDNGMQIVMFTHQDTKVWAELSMILWSAGLQVTSAWCVATETESGGLKQGNYVKGTVLMVLRKRTSDAIAFEDDLYEEIRDEVQDQIDSMRDLDDVENPDFNDGDYLLAAYVAALKVLTSYKEIEGIDVQYELERARDNSEDSPVTKIINAARKEAYDYLVPEGISSSNWSKLSPEERFYLKGLAMELNGNRQMSAFQELARGFAVRDYAGLLGSTKANAVRLKTPSELRMTQITDDGFGSTLLRHILVAVYLSANTENVSEGLGYLRSHYHDNNLYWSFRSQIISILEFMAKVKGNDNVAHWQDVAEYILMLKEAIRNDSL